MKPFEKHTNYMDKCKVCGTTEGVKGYIIADNLEEPRPYCDKCWENFQLKLMLRIAQLD
jgi:transposase-like protein